MKYPKANKDLGQHFLRDQNTIDKITSLPSEDIDGILEIGPGPGVLCEKLAQLNLPYKIIEADRRFEEYLSPFIRQENMVFTDALDFDLKKALSDWGWDKKNIWLVSNLPYNISAPLTVKMLEIPSIKYMSLMYQKEVAFKIIGDTSKKEMGSLMALCQNFFDVKSLCKVSKGAFNPPPKVESQVLSFRRKNEIRISFAEFGQYEGFLRKLFAFKRKQLGTVLKGHYTKDHINEVLNDIEIDVKIRAEALSLDQVYDLYRKLN